jgi:DNA-binding MarR family transcriptional regulator
MKYNDRVADEQRDFGILLALAYSTFVDELHAEHRRTGFDDLRRSFGYVFRALDREELSAAQLADRLGVSDQAMTHLIDEMEAKGYVERHRDARDRRVKRLRLAPRGRAALRIARGFHARYERALEDRLGAASAAALRTGLEGLLEGADEEELARRLRPT